MYEFAIGAAFVLFLIAPVVSASFVGGKDKPANA